MGTIESRRGPSGKLLPGLKMDFKEAWGNLKNLFHKKGILLAYLIGSHARKEARDVSDIDIAVLLEKSPDEDGRRLYSAYKELMLDIREALGSERFDLVLLNDAPPALSFDVIREGISIYFRDAPTLNRFEMDTIRRFQDTNYLRMIQDDYLRERARKWYSKREAF